MRIIDFHTHAFPDAIAVRAIPQLEEEGDIKAVLDGRISSLLDSMDRAGVEVSVVASIATRPDRFETILEWSRSIASDRLVVFPSVHPAAPDLDAQVRRIAAEGFKGLKLHPYYQDFFVDEDRLAPLYAAAQDTGLIVLMHTGFDLAFERVRRGDPTQIRRVLDAFPKLKLITSHLLAWMDWDEARRVLLGQPVYTDVSMSIESMPPEMARELILGHPREYLLFGTDSPWIDQAAHVALVRSLDLGADYEAAMFHENAERLLGV
jgi:hypothetical protein